MTRTGRVQTARYQIRDAALSSEFGQQMAMKWFGRDLSSLTAEFGTYKSGPRKGLCKGYVMWLKIEAGGWVYRQGCGGYVLHPSVRVHCVVSNEDHRAISLQCGADAIDSLGRFFDRQDPKTSHDRAMRNAIDRINDQQESFLVWLDIGFCEALTHWESGQNYTDKELGAAAVELGRLKEGG